MCVMRHRPHYALHPVCLSVRLSVCPVSSKTENLTSSYHVRSNWQSTFAGGPHISEWISTKFGIGGPLAHVINCADFFVDRFRGIDFVGG